MKFESIQRIFLAPKEIHIICAVTSIISILPILFPEVMPQNMQAPVCQVAGTIFLISVGISTGMMAIATITHIFKLSNTRAFWQFLAWGGTWFAAWLVFCLIAMVADVAPPPTEEEQQQQLAPLCQPNDVLLGPNSLIIPIEPADQPTNTIIKAKALNNLAQKYDGYALRAYLEKSLRWAGYTNHTRRAFYAHPGHVVMVPPVSGDIPGTVHASFLQSIQGEQIPTNFTKIHAGSPLPLSSDGKTPVTDIALHLGDQHYLLLAWRGASNRQTVTAALNAAIANIDNRLAPLSVLLKSFTPPKTEDENAIEEALAHTLAPLINTMTSGKRFYDGDTPDFNLKALPTIMGTYQAELYANPREAGTIEIVFTEQDSQKHCLTCRFPALYDKNPKVLLRHDIPGSVQEWVYNNKDINIPQGTQSNFFVLAHAQDNKQFHAIVEVWFIPKNIAKPKKLLLNKRYNVRHYLNVTPEKKAPTVQTGEGLENEELSISEETSATSSS